GDVRMRGDELGDGPHFRRAQWPRPGAALDVGGLPVAGPVAVHVVAEGAVLVDAPVAIVVDAFSAQELPVAILARLDAREDARVVDVAAPASAAHRNLLPHAGDAAVA